MYIYKPQVDSTTYINLSQQNHINKANKTGKKKRGVPEGNGSEKRRTGSWRRRLREANRRFGGEIDQPPATEKRRKWRFRRWWFKRWLFGRDGLRVGRDGLRWWGGSGEVTSGEGGWMAAEREEGSGELSWVERDEGRRNGEEEKGLNLGGLKTWDVLTFLHLKTWEQITFLGVKTWYHLTFLSFNFFFLKKR